MASKLRRDKRGRETYDSLADLYAIIKTTERLERAYVRDHITPAVYELECDKLISQFKSLASSLRNAVPSVEDFARTYCMDCGHALNRLLVVGIPATTEHRAKTVAVAATSLSTASVAECVHHFISAMDTLKLNMVAVDQVHPLLSDLSSSLSKLTGSILSDDFEGLQRCREWLSRLVKMAADDELTKEEARQLQSDLDSAYEAFMKALPKDGASA